MSLIPKVFVMSVPPAARVELIKKSLLFIAYVNKFDKTKIAYFLTLSKQRIEMDFRTVSGLISFPVNEIYF